MHLRRIKANSMREAMARMRAEMGADAIIIACEDLAGGGVEVTAATERRRSDSPAISPVAEQLNLQLQARLRGEARAEPSDGANPHSPATGTIAALLAHHRVPDLLLARISRATRAHPASTAQTALARGLEMCLSFQPIGDKLAGSLMLIGMPGTGKTVSAAKLAARAVLAGQQVDFITADTMRSGAVAQSKAYAEALDQDVVAVRGADELALMLETRADLGRNRPCIVDTPATNVHDDSDVDHTVRLVQAARESAAAAGIEPIGVMAADGDAEDMADAALFFAELGCRRVIVTRTNATRRLGGVIQALAAARLAAAEFGIKPYLADGLVAATAPRLATMLIDKSATAARNPRPQAAATPRRQPDDGVSAFGRPMRKTEPSAP